MSFIPPSMGKIVRQTEFSCLDSLTSLEGQLLKIFTTINKFSRRKNFRVDKQISILKRILKPFRTLYTDKNLHNILFESCCSLPKIIHKKMYVSIQIHVVYFVVFLLNLSLVSALTFFILILGKILSYKIEQHFVTNSLHIIRNKIHTTHIIWLSHW